MEAAKRFEDLEVWQRAHQMVLMVYRCSVHFPKDEIFGLRSQLRRAAVSVPSNIAEGFGRRSHADKLRIYNIAQTSLDEVRYQIILARDLEYMNSPELFDEVERVGRMLGSYVHAIATNRRGG